ncbi:crotonase [Mycolicibacterium moriokaense]|uniref:Crotonase n=2 Tax=Mycolicibacterium moriokaense TaxID=39691 RepID=A0AAD1H6H2_9MYCO|nr:crotonase [Mycolicibacterium moriokaense]
MAVLRFDDYSQRYRHVAMTRDDLGVLQLRLHTDGGPLIWGEGPHTELSYCFADVASDRENRVIVLTGTGQDFCARIDDSWAGPMTPEKWDLMFHHGNRLLRNLLDIEVPVIGAIQGKALLHAELAVLSDVVLASADAVIGDPIHFKNGIVSGDGVHIIWPMLLGPNRGRYFLLTGERLSAQQAHELDVVGEVLPREQLLTRAHEIARSLAAKPDLVLRYTRHAITHRIKQALAEGLSLGLALEGLGAQSDWPG